MEFTYLNYFQLVIAIKEQQYTRCYSLVLGHYRVGSKLGYTLKLIDLQEVHILAHTFILIVVKSEGKKGQSIKTETFLFTS